ncbi:MAG: type II secretion system protein, partial [Patescibacteria group bacterium]
MIEPTAAKKGFTLIELLIVIGIIGFLAAAILVAVDPVKRIQDSRDARRSAETNGLLNAILNQQTDAVALFPGDTTATTGAPIIESGTKAQVIVRSVSGIDCDTTAATPLCTQLPAGYSLDTTAGAPALQCVAKIDMAVQAPGALTANAVTAGGSVDAGTHSYKVTFVTRTGETDAGAVSNTATTAAANLTVPLVSIPTAPAASGTLARKIYRTVAGAAVTGPWLLLTTLNDNSATTYSDVTADASLGAAAPSSNTTGLAPKYIAESPIDPGTSIDLSGNVALGNSNTGY